MNNDENLNGEDEHDFDTLESSGDILAWNAKLRDLAESRKGSKKPKPENLMQSQSAQRSGGNSSTASSTKCSSVSTCQEKKEVINSINPGYVVEKKEESYFGGLSSCQTQISTALKKERCDPKDKVSKTTKITIPNLISQDNSEDIKPANGDFLEQIETETEIETDTVTTEAGIVTQKPNKSLFSEEGFMISARPSKRKKTPKSKSKSKSKSKKAEIPQTKSRNLDKSILLEIFKIFICFYNLNEPDYKEICGKIQISDKEWDKDILKNQILVTALENEESLTEEDFEEWLKENKTRLKKILEKKKLGLFVPFYNEIRETKSYIKKDDPMDYFRTYKNSTSHDYLRNLTKEGELICWILVVKFSLIWLPKGSPNENMKLLPVKKDTVGMVYWMITTRTEPKTKNLIKDFKEREKLRKNLQKTFEIMEQSARHSYPQMRNLLNRIKVIGCCVPEFSLTILSDLMQAHLKFQDFEDSYCEALREAQSKSWFDLFDFNEGQGERLNLNTLSRYFSSWKMQIEYIEGSCESHDGSVENEKEEEKGIRKEKKCNNGDGQRSQLSFTGASEEEDMARNKKFKKR